MISCLHLERVKLSKDESERCWLGDGLEQIPIVTIINVAGSQKYFKFKNIYI